MGQASWKAWAESIKKDTCALYWACRDPGVPVWAKIVIGLVVAYALSPIDLIPDFIPLIGYVDDLVLLPLGIWLALQLIPDGVWKECRAQAAGQIVKMPTGHRAVFVIIAIWLLAGAGLGWWVISLCSCPGGL